MTTKELEIFPLYVAYEIDLIHVAKAPVPLQPKQSNNLNKFKTYFLSPRKVFTMLTSWGRGYTFCDRFNGEHLISITQTVDPAAMQEKDPIKRLKMFSVEIEVRARLHMLQSVFPLHAIIHAQNET